MKRCYLLSFVIFSIILLLNNLNLYAQQNSPTVQWQKLYGGSALDGASSVQQTRDGGYIITGSSDSKDGDVTGNHGLTDYWVIKLDKTGNLQWEKSLGGQWVDCSGITLSLSLYHVRGQYVQQTHDGGYIVSGLSQSNNGDVTGNPNLNSLWVVKLDTIGGITWETALEGGFAELLGNGIVLQTNDGGYFVAGQVSSNGGVVTGVHGNNNDYWAAKLDSAGKLLWEKSYGGTMVEFLNDICTTSDGGLILAGGTFSRDGDVTGYHYNPSNYEAMDEWLVKIDGNGNIQWERCYGGYGDDKAISIKQTCDGGYLVLGDSRSNDGDVVNNPTGGEWITKLDSLGNIQNQMIGSNNLGGDQIFVVSDGGFIVRLYSQILKFDAEGILQWQKNITDSVFDNFVYNIEQTEDSGFVAVGWAFPATKDSVRTGYHGGGDMWVEKLSPSVQVPLQACIGVPSVVPEFSFVNAVINLANAVSAPSDSLTFNLQFDPSVFVLDSILSPLCNISWYYLSPGILHITLRSCVLPLRPGALCTAIFIARQSDKDTMNTSLQIADMQSYPPNTPFTGLCSAPIPCSAPIAVVPLCGMRNLDYMGSTSLAQNYPNPFTGTTAIHVMLSQADANNAQLMVYNVLGEQVADLTSELSTDANIVFNAGANKAGVYYYVLQTASGRITRQMFVVK